MGGYSKWSGQREIKVHPGPLLPQCAKKSDKKSLSQVRPMVIKLGFVLISFLIGSSQGRMGGRNKLRKEKLRLLSGNLRGMGSKKAVNCDSMMDVEL